MFKKKEIHTSLEGHDVEMLSKGRHLPLRTLLFVKTPNLYKTLIFIFNQGLTELTFYKFIRTKHLKRKKYPEFSCLLVGWWSQEVKSWSSLPRLYGF